MEEYFNIPKGMAGLANQTNGENGMGELRGKDADACIPRCQYGPALGISSRHMGGGGVWRSNMMHTDKNIINSVGSYEGSETAGEGGLPDDDGGRPAPP